GVGRGIKWLSNLNLGLSFLLLAFFLVFGATSFAFQSFAISLWDYLTTLPLMILDVYPPEESKAAQWQGDWTIFYWAWWISFAPFVGLFLARISKGRTVREFVLGAILAPSAMCFVWFALVGGTAMDLELSGRAQGAVFSSGLSDQLYAVLDLLSSGIFTSVLYGVVVVLLLTYLVTSADSAILIINTVNAAGDEGPKARPHILFWGAAFGFLVGTLLLVGGLEAIQTAMVIGALPFSLVMVLMVISLFRAIWSENRAR
ncbi:MAG: BCCT family transporter, partial [Myxococcota bacterium]